MQFLKDLGHISLPWMQGASSTRATSQSLKLGFWLGFKVGKIIIGRENDYCWWKLSLFLRMIIVGENDESHSVVSMNLR